MPYSYEIAKSVLKETDKDRMLAVLLSSDNPMAVANWDIATTAFGAASIESMKKMVQNALKKVADAGGKDAPASASASIPSTPTPMKAKSAFASASATKAKLQTYGGRKRKADAFQADDDDDEETVLVGMGKDTKEVKSRVKATPKRGRKGVSSAAVETEGGAVIGAEEEIGETIVVKMEKGKEDEDEDEEDELV